MKRINYPIFFTATRVWRCYTGGVLLGRFVGNASEPDDYFPEDWLASTVYAVNDTHSQGPDEGLSETVLEDGSKGPLLAELLSGHAEEILGKEHKDKFSDQTGLLCKYLDSAVRLPIQCHPDAAMAKRLFNSRFGKTESWHIIDTRRINGQEPYILMGFRPGVNREKFSEAVYAQDAAAMESMLHKIKVQPGQTYFVPGRMPHAIGPGVFMLEVQEPSDLVIQPERYCAGVRLSDAQMWNSLLPEQAMDVFDFTCLTESELLDKVFAQPRTKSSGKVKMDEIIGGTFTDSFGLWKATIEGSGTVKLPSVFGIVVVENGRGTMRWLGCERKIKRGDYFLQPASIDSMEYFSEEKIELLICLPPGS